MITLPYSKIEVVPPQDGEHLTLDDVWYDKEHQCLVAADGFIMVVVPVEAEESDTGGHIPLEAIKAARKATKGRAYLEADKDWRVSSPFVEDGQWERPTWPFPDYRQVVPVADEECVTVTLDARRLMQLAEALCEEENRAKRVNGKNRDIFGVTLTFKPDGVSPILVYPLHEPNKPRGRFGIIMPMHKHGRKGT